MTSEIRISPLNINAIRQLGEQDRSLYVINTTDHRGTRSRGDLHVSINDDFGESHTVVIPNTWIPFNLARYGSVKPMIRSKSFLDALARKNIIVVAEEDAKNILSTKEGKEELSLIDEKYKKLGTMADSEDYTINATPTIINEAIRQPSEETSKEDNINPNDMIMREQYLAFTTGRLKEAAFIEAMNNMQPPPSFVVLQEISSMGRLSPNLIHAVGQLMSGGSGAQPSSPPPASDVPQNKDPVSITY